MTSGSTPYSEDELLQQWNFLDAMVERQAASLRAGNQDPEEDEHAAVTPVPAGDGELIRLRERVATLDAEAETWHRERARYDEMEAERTKLSEEVETLRQRLARRESELARLSHSHSDLLEALRQAHTEVETFRSQMAPTATPLPGTAPPLISPAADVPRKKSWFRRG